MANRFDAFKMRGGFDGRQMNKMREVAAAQRIGFYDEYIRMDAGRNLGDILGEAMAGLNRPKPVDPSTIEPDPSLGLCEIRAKLIEYETADFKSLIDLDNLEPYGRDSFIVRKKPFEAFAGIERLGEGCYSNVYALDDKRALKVVKGRDDGYARFIDRIKSHPHNIHLPKVYYSGVWGDKTVYVIERLTNGDEDVKRMFISLVEQGAGGKANTPNPYITVAPSIFEVAQILSDLCNDLHSGNVMFRGDCPVVTDPTS